MTGAISGFLWIGVSAGILLFTHNLTVVDKHYLWLPGIWMLAVLINAMTQELLVKGYIYQLLKTRFSMSVAVVVTTAIFFFFYREEPSKPMQFL